MTPNIKDEALKLALEALGWTDEWRPEGLKEQAIAAIREALAEQPAQPCGYPYCGCNSKAWCKVEQPARQDPVECERCEELGYDKARYFRLYEQACIELQKIKKQEAAAEIKIAYSDLEGEVIEILSCELDAGTYKLYTSPPIEATPLASQRSVKPWVGLTEDEIDFLELKYAPPIHPDFETDADHCYVLIKKTEAKLKEKNA